MLDTHSQNVDHDVEVDTSASDGDGVIRCADASCQTDKELSELTILQRKEFLQLKNDNVILTAEISKLDFLKIKTIVAFSKCANKLILSVVINFL